MTGKRAKLSAKQERFCQEYMVDLNAAQAAIRTGYSERSAKVKGCQILSMPHIKARIKELKSKRIARVEANADYVLRRLIEIDELDVSDILDANGNILAVSDWPQSWRRTVSGVDVSELFDGSGDERKVAGLLKKIKWPDKLRNLELLGKHIDVGAFRETIDHNHSGEIEVRSITRRVVDPAAQPGARK